MKYVLFLIAILFSNQAVALDCSKQPTCEELNYSKEDNPKCDKNGYILCPYDQSYKKCVQYNCETLGFTQSDKSSWCGKISKCPTDNTFTLCKALCEVGDVYYDNGTCGYVDDYDNTKTPVGVVFYTTDEGRHGTVINLKDLSIDSETYVFNPDSPYDSDLKMIPYGLHNTDVPEIENHPYWDKDKLKQELENRSSDMYEGKRLTAVLAQTEPKDGSCLNGNYQTNTPDYAKYCQATAAKAALAFYPPLTSPGNPLTGQGKWYLPAIGNWSDFCEPRHTVNATLKKLAEKGAQAAQLTWANSWSVSTTEQLSTAEWTMAMDNCNFGLHYKNSPKYVRVFLDF